MPAPGVGAVCGSCPAGFSGDGEKCYGRLLITSISIIMWLIDPNWNEGGQVLNSQ